MLKAPSYDFQKSSEYINERREALTELQRLDLGRRADICSGVQTASTALFHRRQVLLAAGKERKESEGINRFCTCALVFAGVLSSWLGETAKAETFAWFLYALAILHWYVVERAREELNEKIEASRLALMPLLSTWVGAGASADGFWSFGELAEADELRLDSDNYKEWWHTRQHDLLASIDGKQPYRIVELS